MPPPRSRRPSAQPAEAGRCGCSSPSLAARTIAVEFGPAEAIDSIEKTEFAGISTVPPGCYAIARDGDVRIYPYWDWEIPTAEQMRADTRSEAEIVEEFRQALLDAVQQRLVADVEVASYLSGGIDSCAVLGLAQQEMERPIRAFTLTFDNPLYDEASIAEAQAKHVGATYHPIPITGREIAESFKDAIWYSETQMFNATASPSICSAAPCEPRASRWCSPAKAPTKCSEATRTSAWTR
jgi:asparagine synthetase B (glutamine-hydrolysing)